MALLLAALLAACAGTEGRPASLTQAYAEVDAARGDRRIRALAPAGLYDAETALAEAFRAWQAGRPEPEVSQLAEIARQRAATARLEAAARLAQRRLDIVPAQARRAAPEPRGRIEMTGASGPALDGAERLRPDAGGAGGAAQAPGAGAPSRLEP